MRAFSKFLKPGSVIDLPLSFVVRDLLAELFAKVTESHRKADREINDFLRRQRRLSAPEREFIARTIYAMIRHRRALQDAARALPFKPSAHTFVLLHLLGSTHLRAQDLPRPDAEIEPVLAALSAHRRRPPPEDPAEALAQAHSLPGWLAAELLKLCGEEGGALLAAALKRPPPLTLRANLLRGDRDGLRGRLAREGVRTTPTRYSPVGLTVIGHARVMQTRAFAEGLFEIQDEGSQLIGLLAEARPGQRVIDACAGAGGKTLHLAADMDNKGTLLALDAHEHRLDQLRPRARRAGVHNVQTHALDAEGSRRLSRLKGSADVVLVDAPCSGTGALRRTPDDAWRMAEGDVERFSEIQRALLARYAGLVRPGGRLVYATCSMIPEENQRVAEDFLQHHPGFEATSAWEVLDRIAAQTPEALDGAPWMRLLPHVHGTDGFFAAVFTRRRGGEGIEPDEGAVDEDEGRQGGEGGEGGEDRG